MPAAGVSCSVVSHTVPLAQPATNALSAQAAITEYSTLLQGSFTVPQIYVPSATAASAPLLTPARVASHYLELILLGQHASPVVV